QAKDEAGAGIFSSEDLSAIDDILDDELGNMAVGYSPRLIQSKDIVYVWKNGKKRYYQVRDEALLRAIGELTPAQIGKILKASEKLMSVTKTLITGLNPYFAVRNFKRDIEAAWKNSNDNRFLTAFVPHYMTALKHVISHDSVYQQWRAMGGGNNTDIKARRDAVADALKTAGQGKAERIIKSIFHPLRLIMNFNEAVESIPRVMAFEQTLKNGGDAQEAIYNASNITVNFKRHGTRSRGLNSIFMFNNPSVQGLYTVYRSFARVAPREAAKRLCKYLLTAIVMAALENFISNAKDPDRKDRRRLSSYQKNSYYCFAIGDGKFVKIPKAREQGLLTAFTERSIDLMFGDKHAFDEFSDYVAANVLPPMLPLDSFVQAAEEKSMKPVFHAYLNSTVLGGFADNAFNMDFKGTPIESAYMQYQAPKDRINNNTSAIAAKLGEKLNMSPVQIDHLIDSYGGIIGTLNKGLLPADTDKTLKERAMSMNDSNFIADSLYSTNVLNRVYNGRDKAKKALQENP
ncbi:MAG: LPD38 domain-containing protein, partial [Clostridia bacterium]